MYSKDDFVIRSYDSKDKEQILNIFRLNTPKYFAPEEEIHLLHYLEEEIEFYFVAEVAGKIVGCGGINFEGETIGKISWDMVHPHYQGKSVGSMLVKTRIDKLKSLPHIKTIVVRTSQYVYRFYEKQGFELKHTLKDYWAPGFDLYFMEFKDNRN